jgi:hypothetical protein
MTGFDRFRTVFLVLEISRTGHSHGFEKFGLKTGPVRTFKHYVDRSFAVFCSPWTGPLEKILKLWICRFIELLLRMLIYVKNWCSYENALVHLLFSSFFLGVLSF